MKKLKDLDDFWHSKVPKSQIRHFLTTHMKVDIIFPHLQLHNFSWCNISHALLVPFGHLNTVPSTEDKWYFQLYFWKEKNLIIQGPWDKLMHFRQTCQYYGGTMPTSHKKNVPSLSEAMEAKWSWWNKNWMFYIESPYLRIPKILGFWLKCHWIIKKCSSEMHQFESADPVQLVHLNQFKNIFKNTTFRGISLAYNCSASCSTWCIY